MAIGTESNSLLSKVAAAVLTGVIQTGETPRSFLAVDNEMAGRKTKSWDAGAFSRQ
jgi:hypothetical protein